MGKTGAFLLGAGVVGMVAWVLVWRRFVHGWDEQERLARGESTETG